MSDFKSKNLIKHGTLFEYRHVFYVIRTEEWGYTILDINGKTLDRINSGLGPARTMKDFLKKL